MTSKSNIQHSIKHAPTLEPLLGSQYIEKGEKPQQEVWHDEESLFEAGKTFRLSFRAWFFFPVKMFTKTIFCFKYQAIFLMRYKGRAAGLGYIYGSLVFCRLITSRNAKKKKPQKWCNQNTIWQRKAANSNSWQTETTFFGAFFFLEMTEMINRSSSICILFWCPSNRLIVVR